MKQLTQAEKRKRLVAVRKHFLHARSLGRTQFEASGHRDAPCGLTDDMNEAQINSWSGDFVEWKLVAKMIPDNYQIDVYVTEFYGVGWDAPSELITNVAINIGDAYTAPRYRTTMGEWVVLEWDVEDDGLKELRLQSSSFVHAVGMMRNIQHMARTGDVKQARNIFEAWTDDDEAFRKVCAGDYTVDGDDVLVVVPE